MRQGLLPVVARALRRLLAVCGLACFSGVPCIAQAPNGFHYVRTDEDPSSVVYDSTHGQFFVAVPASNKIYVVPDSNPTAVSTIDVASPYALDLSPDDSQLYVGSDTFILEDPAAEGIFVIDTSSLNIVDFIRPTVPANPAQIFFPNVNTTARYIAAVDNGKIFYLADELGVSGNEEMLAYDPTTGISTVRPPTSVGPIHKSANGEEFVVTSANAGQTELLIYSSSSDSYSTYPVPSNVQVTDEALSPDGTRLLVSGHLLYDQGMNLVADLNPAESSLGYRGSNFSPDGTKVYVGELQTPGAGSSYSNPVVAVYQTSNGALLGYVPAPQFTATPLGSGIAVNPQGLGILINDRGFAEIDLSHPNPNLAGTATQTLNYPNVAQPSSGSSGNPSPITISGAGFRSGANVYFGSTVGSNVTVASPNNISVQPPSGLTGQPDLTVSFPDGWSAYAPEGYSYGPAVLYQNVNAGDANGGTTVELIGYGFSVSTTQPQVTIGGAPASGVSLNLVTISPFTFPIQHLTFTTPPGAEGYADIVVTSGSGSTTVKNGFRYVSHTLISGIAPLQTLLDETRGKLYVANATTGDVMSIDANTLAVATLIHSPGNPATGLAITPDASKLLVISASGGTLQVFDLNAGTIVKTFYPVPGGQPTSLIPNSIVATSRGTALVGLYDPALSGGGDLYEVDLATGDATTFYLGLGCGPSYHMLLAPSADGSAVYISNDNSDGSSGGCISLWNAALDSVVENRNYPNGVTQIATTGLGDRLLVDGVGIGGLFSPMPSWYDNGLFIVSTIAPFDNELFEVAPAPGEKFQSAGALEYVPTTYGIEVYDAYKGHLSVSIGIPGGVAATVDGLTVDSTGASLYVAENSGLGVIRLGTAPLSIGSIIPAQGSASGGSTVTLLGSGFANGATVTIDGQPAGAQVISSTEISFVMPAISAAKVAIAVTNPDGESYTLPAAYDASVQTTSVPLLTSLSPLIVSTDNPINLTISGSGFVAASRVLFNGVPVQTEYLSSTQIVAYISSVLGPGAEAVTVANPAPGGTSNALSLQVQDPSPTIVNLSPTSIPVGSPAFNLSVLGNNGFSPDSTVLWNGSPRTTLYVNTSELIAEISASDVTAEGAANVAVSTLSAAAPLSNAFSFSITSQGLASVQPQALSFSPQLKGTKSPPTPLILTSTGVAALSITSISLADTTDFSETNNCHASLPAGQTCTIQVSFTPGASIAFGQVQSTLTISENSSSSPQVVKLFGQAVDIQLQLNSASINVTAGQSAVVPLTVTGLGGGISDPIQFSCSGLPTGAACQFNPATLVPGAGPNALTMTISTTGSASADLLPGVSGMLAGVLALLIFACWRVRGAPRTLLMLFVMLITLALGACGGSGSANSNTSQPPNPDRTPAGAYTITVTAADGTVQRSTTFTLSVTAS